MTKVYRFQGEADIAPLTAEEKRWLKRAQRLFREAPERFGFYTGGDCDFTVFDEPAFKAAEGEVGTLDLCDGSAEAFVLDTIHTNRCFHSTSH
jgi:hypothetical protein